MPLYSDSSNYYYSGGSSQLYSPYYSSGLSSTSSSPSSYISSYNRAYPGSYMVPLLPSSSTRTTPIISSSSSNTIGSSSSSILGLSSRYQPKLTTITESSVLTGRHSGHSSLMPLTRIQSPKYCSSYGGSSSSSSSSNSSHRYIPARPIAINTADIDVSSARYRRTPETVERKREPEILTQKEQEQTQKQEQQHQEPQQPEQPEQQSTQQQPRRSTIRRNRPVVRLSTIRRRSKERAEPPKEQQKQQQQLKVEEHQFRDLPPATEPSLSWRQKLADELAAFPTISNKKSPGEILRERFYIRDGKQEEETAPRQQQHLEKPQQQQPQPAIAISSSSSSEESEELEQEEKAQLTEKIRRLSLVKCPTFHDICQDISSDKIDDDLNAGELRRRASIIQEQEQELLNKLQKSNSGSFQLIHLERRSSHDSNNSTTTADESQSSPSSQQQQQPKKKSKKLRHKITAVVEVQNAPTSQYMPSVLELEELPTPAATSSNNYNSNSPKPKFTVNVESVEEHHKMHKIFKLPKKKSPTAAAAAAAGGDKQALPEGFMKAAPKAKTSPLKKVKEQLQEAPNQQVNVAQIFTFDETAIQTAAAAASEATAATAAATPIKTEGVATPKPIRKQLQKSESGEDFWSQFGTRETLYMTNRKKALGERQLEATQEEAIAATPTTTALLKSQIVIELQQPAAAAAATPSSPKSTTGTSKPTAAATATKTEASSPYSAPTTPKLATAKSEPTTPVATPATTKLTTANATVSSAKSEPTIPVATPAITKLTTTGSSKPTAAATATKTEASAPISTPATPKLATAKSEPTTPMATPATPKQPAASTGVSSKSEPTTPKAEAAVAPKPATPKSTTATTITTKPEASSPKSTPAATLKSPTGTAAYKTEAATVAITTKATAKTEQTTAAPQLAINTTTATQKTAAALGSLKSIPAAPKTATVGAVAAATKQSGNAINSTVVMTTALTTTTATTTTTAAVNSKFNETAPATTTSTMAKTTTATAPKINAGQAAKSPEQQQAAAAVAAAKINKTTHNIERQQEQQQPLDATAATAALKQETETKTKLSETVEPKSKVQSPKTTKPKSAGKLAKKKVAATPTTTATATATTTTTCVAADATAITTDSNVTPINADQFITLAPTKAATLLATNASSPTALATATTILATATTPTTTTTTTTADKQQSSVAAVADAAAASASAADNERNSCGEGVGNNLSKFATVSNLAQYLRDVDADLDDYIPSSAENSNSDSDDDDDDDDYSSANLSASMKKKQRKEKKKQKTKDAGPARFDPQKKVKIDTSSKCYVKEEAPRYPLVATPRPLWKREKIVYSDENTDDESSEQEGSSGGSLDDDNSDEDDNSDARSSNNSSTSSSNNSVEFDEEHTTAATAATSTTTTAPITTNKISCLTPTATTSSGSVSVSSSPSIIRMSTCSNDSGFEGGTAPSSPKKMLECDVNCHKKCERLTANLCGVNQKLIVEALNHVKRGAREARDSPSTPPSLNPAYKIEANDEQDETSYTYSQFQKSGRFTAPATVIPRFKNYSVDDFHFLAVLGKGSFGKVLLAELRDTTYYYAIKCLKKDVVLEDDDVDSTLIERKVLALGTKHPYLCHLFCTFQTESHLFFVMEYLNGGDLMFHIQESGRFSEERARFYGAEIISGLKFLHKKGIIYRDLKLDNVLLDYEGHVRIADFGMCKLQIYLDKTADSFCGTPDYMAPEIIKGEKYNQNVDWWSFGVLLYEMLIGQSPFSGCDEDELFWSICNEIPWFPVYISAEATGILRGLLEKDYTKRIGSQYSPAGDIADHLFFRPIEWNLLEKRQIEPPFKPQVKHPLDTQYFDRVFTRERVRLTPIDKEILASMDQKQFHGFTYTNPHITLD